MGSLYLDNAVADSYKSNSQKARVLSELWASQFLYCLFCGNPFSAYKNNTHVKDFFCEPCSEDYQLKSSQTSMRNKIQGGQYHKLFESVRRGKHPHFLLLKYRQTLEGRYEVIEIFAVPKKYIQVEMILCRKALGPGARREGWVGCYVDIHTIPDSARVWLCQNGVMLPKEDVLKAWKKAIGPKSHKQKTISVWTKDVLGCVNQLPNTIFHLSDVYRFEALLHEKHPENKHVLDKIRQQLQVLRDVGILRFHGKGKYERI